MEPWVSRPNFLDRAAKPSGAHLQREGAAAAKWNLVLQNASGEPRREIIEAATIRLEKDSTGAFAGRWIVFLDAEGKELARLDLRKIVAMSKE